MLSTERTWDAFYGQHGRCREWYLTARETLRHVLREATRRPVAGDCLHSGCGSSSLSCMLHETFSGGDGDAARVVNTDFSAPVIEAMRARCPGVFFQQEDARRMSFGRGAFGLIVDKGTLDAMSMTERAQQRQAVLDEYRRVLKDGVGTCLVFSLFGPTYWKPFLQNSPVWMWDGKLSMQRHFFMARDRRRRRQAHQRLGGNAAARHDHAE